MIILVLNAGSSSIKYQFFHLPLTSPLGKGSIEHIGEDGGVKDHKEAFELIQKSLIREGLIDTFESIDAIGHRVVHGGDIYDKATLITAKVLDDIQSLSTLAPLHNPANALGISIIQEILPNTPQIAVFDTAFHQTMPPENYLYALPKQLCTLHKIRRYGFHGTSHQYVAETFATQEKSPMEDLNLITIHLGNGASMCAIKEGKSWDTSMGFTPLEGLVMGTRSGDIDPAIIGFLLEHTDMDSKQVDTLLNKQSGLKGLSGSNDMRDLLDKVALDDKEAQSTLELYTNRIKKYLGSYIALLGNVDAIIFTGGIGEHASLVREKVLDNLEALGILFDKKANSSKEQHFKISSQQSPISIWVIPTNEELSIAQQSYELINKKAITYH